MIEVHQIANIVGGNLVLNPRGRIPIAEAAGLITNIPASPDGQAGRVLTMELVIGEGNDTKIVLIEVPLFSASGQSPDIPSYLRTTTGRIIIHYMSFLFLPERGPLNSSEHDEILLRMRKIIHQEDKEIAELKNFVANLDATLEFKNSGPRRQLIPEDVKLLVWARDGGSCIRCGAQQKLQFDHVIPVAKGGSNSAGNIQLLCQPCNLLKSDRISVL